METNEELNRWAHELLGLCWHDVSWNYHTGKCQKCGEIVLYTWHGSTGNPNYCSSLDLAAKVEAKAIEMAGLSVYVDAIESILSGDDPHFGQDTTVYIHQHLTAPALTRVQAAKRAVEGK